MQTIQHILKNKTTAAVAGHSEKTNKHTQHIYGMKGI